MFACCASIKDGAAKFGTSRNIVAIEGATVNIEGFMGIYGSTCYCMVGVEHA